MTDTVVTRFAPSPTGFLHIGGARTALFNWLFARHHGGRFLLRIEDTDRKRSTQDAIEAILDGLRWLELHWDGEVVYQSERATRHAELAQSLLDEGKAYRCYCTPEELAAMRDKARAEGRSVGYDGTWRNRDPAEAPPGVPPVIRFRAPRDGDTVIADLIQGEVEVPNAQLDDMVLLRADGTPTYMLSVVVDDHDMGVTHAIRGDDHLTNAFRQTQLFRALGWEPPAYAHMSLIHGADGAKLSKRHGALGVEAYREMGFLPEAMCNYLVRLGWSHGDDEIISRDDAIRWFGLEAVGRAPARFDMDKLTSLNAHYIREADDVRLIGLVRPLLEARPDSLVDEAGIARIHAALPALKQRARTIPDLAERAAFFVARRPLALAPKAEKLLDDDARTRLGRLEGLLDHAESWTEETLESLVRDFAEREGVKLGAVAQPLRAALTGSTESPGIFEVMVALGKGETRARLGDVAPG